MPADGVTGEALLEVQDATLLIVATPTHRGGTVNPPVQMPTTG